MNIYEEAVRAWGFEPQVDKTIEECAELIVALEKFRYGKVKQDVVLSLRNRVPKLREADLRALVVEEIADVEVMCAALRVIFGSERVDEVKATKLRRLRRLLNAEQTSG